MTHPIPAPRPSTDSLTQNPPRRGPLPGPHCTTCEHPSCRRRRAQRLPRLGGHLAEYRNEHVLAATIQARNPHLIVWFGEQTGSFWVASSTGLAEVPDAGTLDRLFPQLVELW